jgi:hypothetical protein
VCYISFAPEVRPKPCGSLLGVVGFFASRLILRGF